MREFQNHLDRYSLILSRDPLGATPLHKAVVYGHHDLAEHIASSFGPNALDIRDHVRSLIWRYSKVLIKATTKIVFILGWTYGVALCSWTARSLYLQNAIEIWRQGGDHRPGKSPASHYFTLTKLIVPNTYSVLLGFYFCLAFYFYFQLDFFWREKKFRKTKQQISIFAFLMSWTWHTP